MSSANAWYRERDAEMVRRSDAGEDAWVLAREHGITRTRVLQILREAHPRKTDHQRIQRSKETAEALLARWDAGETYAQIAEDTGYSTWQVQSCISHGKWQRSSQANKYFWLRELAESEREHLRDLLYEGAHHQDWDMVYEAIHVLSDGAREATESGYKRGGGHAL